MILSATRSVYQFSERFFPVRGRYRLLNYICRLLISDSDRIIALAGTEASVYTRYSDAVERSVMLTGVWEPAETKLFEKNVKTGMTILDIGAHAGIHSVRLASLAGASGMVYAFEPGPAKHRWKQNQSLNPQLKMTLIECALGENDGVAEIHTGASGVGCMLEGQRKAELDAGESVISESIPVRTLDGVWEELGRPNIGFIKMDIEGYEYKALLGASRVLESSRPIICFEFSQVYADMQGITYRNLHSLLTRHGYRIETLPGTPVDADAAFSATANLDLVAYPQ
jgi:FkbM family methyltransferase